MIGQLLLGGASYSITPLPFWWSRAQSSCPWASQRPIQSDSMTRCRVSCLYFFLSSWTGVLVDCKSKMKRDLKDNPPTTYDYVFYSHLSMMGIALGASILTGDFWTGLECFIQHPPVAQMVAMVCLLSVIGQCFIFYTICCFDPLVCATITTTRKIWYETQPLTIVWIGVCVLVDWFDPFVISHWTCLVSTGAYCYPLPLKDIP
jgi:UAA transporter family